jgi:hypothetical protein
MAIATAKADFPTAGLIEGQLQDKKTAIRMN